MVGVLENRQCKDSSSVVVRALFTKAPSGWVALDGREIFERTITRDMSWTVALDGSSLGTIRTRDSRPDIKDTWAFVRDRTLDLAPGQRPPRRANPNHRFDGWCEVPYRPLVTVTPGNFKDPEAWTPFNASDDTRSLLLPAFRSAVDSAFICPDDPENAVRFRYASTDLALVGAYHSRSGKTIVGVQLDPQKNSCDGPPGVEWATHWFVLGAKPLPLGTGLQLVDAGDYDADGKSELLFWYDGYNSNGYDLFSSDFRKHVKVRWSYH